VRLFGHISGPHLAHFHATCETDQAELSWEVRNSREVRWRVLRSEREFATDASGLVGSGQSVVMEGTDTNLVDRVVEGTTYYYTVFAEDEHGAWHRQVKVKLQSHDHLSWIHPGYVSQSDAEASYERAELEMPESGDEESTPGMPSTSLSPRFPSMP